MFINEIYSICLMKNGNDVIYANQFFTEEDAKNDFICLMIDAFPDFKFNEKIFEYYFNKGQFPYTKNNEVKCELNRFDLYYNKVEL